MINYEKITRVDVGEICFTPDMVIQACKNSVKAAIPLILKEVSEKANIKTIFVEDVYDSNYPNDTYKGKGFCSLRTDADGETYAADIVEIDKESIISLQDTLEKQLGI